MSVYRRNATRCQRWEFDTQTWHDCPIDAPETTPRDKKREGMVVVPTDDFEAEGPAMLSISALKKACERAKPDAKEIELRLSDFDKKSD